MSKSARVTEVVFAIITAVGIAGSIVSVFIGAYLVFTYAVSSTKPRLETIVASVLAVMLFIAISNLDRYVKLRRIDVQSEQTRELIEQRVVRQVRAASFFNKELDPDDDYYSTAASIYISGITLGKTTRASVDVFGRRLKAGAHLRIITISKEEDVLNQVVRRSFGQPLPDTNYYRARLDSTLTLIKIIAGTDGATGTLEVGLLPYVPSFGITMIDPDLPTGKAVIEVYHHNSQSAAPKFALTAETDPQWFSFFEQQFELMWKASKQLQLLVDGELVGDVSPIGPT